MPSVITLHLTSARRSGEPADLLPVHAQRSPCRIEQRGTKLGVEVQGRRVPVERHPLPPIMADPTFVTQETQANH